MKTLISMVLGIMIPFIMTDNDDPSLLERISWIPETTLYPYYGSKILDTNQYRFVERVGFHPEDYGNLPIYTWDDVQATLYTVDANEDVAMYRKFIPQNKNYIAVPISIGASDWKRYLLLTYTNSGQLIDYLEVSYGIYGSELMLYKQWKIERDMKVTVYHLKSTETETIMLDDFERNQFHLQRIDTEYQIDSTGHFVKLSEKKYQAKSYTRSYLENNSQNIWQGNEVLQP